MVLFIYLFVFPYRPGYFNTSRPLLSMLQKRAFSVAFLSWSGLAQKNGTKVRSSSTDCAIRVLGSEQFTVVAVSVHCFAAAVLRVCLLASAGVVRLW